MEKETETFRSFSFEEELERAKWFKEDLDKGDGWTEAAKGPGYAYWIKTLRGNELVPIKILYMFDMPYPAEVHSQLLQSNTRKDWDKAFIDIETLETYADGGNLVYMRTAASPWPLTDRSFVLYRSPTIEVDWFGKRALFTLDKNGWHPSKSEGEDGLVRATNGGNFTVMMPDEKQPEAACRVFGLTNNLYNGWIPKTNMEWMLKRAIPRTFNRWREHMIEGYERLFKN